MGKLIDFIQQGETLHNHCGYRICGTYFIVYCADIVGYYRGEDSGARYPEYEEDVLLTIPLEPFLQEKGNENITIQQLLASLERENSLIWGEWYTPPQTVRIMKILDSLEDLSMA